MTWLLRILQKWKFYHLKLFARPKTVFVSKSGCIVLLYIKIPTTGVHSILPHGPRTSNKPRRYPGWKVRSSDFFQQGRYQRQTDHPKHGKSFVIFQKVFAVEEGLERSVVIILFGHSRKSPMLHHLWWARCVKAPTGGGNMIGCVPLISECVLLISESVLLISECVLLISECVLLISECVCYSYPSVCYS